MHWHPREHAKALRGMQMLTLEERGAYNTALDLIYDREGPIPDDARWLAGWMGVSVRKWSAIRAALIVKGKLFALNFNGVDCLMNERAAIELENQAKLVRKLSESGAKGGRTRVENEKKSSNNNSPALAPLEARLKLIDKDIDNSSVANATGADAPRDPNKDAWDRALGVLVTQAQMTTPAARAFFGKLLSAHGLEARDLLAPLAEAFNNGTADPQAYLTRAAIGRAKRKASGPQKRVGFV